MPQAARITDTTLHKGAVLTGSSDVMIGGKPAARLSDGHVCPLHPPGGPIAQGSSTVLINNLPAARVGDKVMCVVDATPPVGGKVGGEYKPDKIREDKKVDEAWGKDREEAEEKKAKEAKEGKPPKKPEFKAEFEKKLAEAKTSGEVAKFAGDHGKLLAGSASADAKMSAEISGINNMKAELSGGASAKVSAVQVKGETEGRYGKVGGQADVLTAEAKARGTLAFDTSKGEGEAKVEVGAGASVFKGKVEGETAGWKIPFTDWEIGVGGAAEGTLLGVEAKAHAGATFNKKDGLRIGAGAKVSAFLAGLGFELNIFIRPRKKSKPAPDMLEKGEPTVLIGDDGLKEKQARLAQRKALIEEARKKAADPKTSAEERKKLGDAADRLERNNEAVERAKLSGHVYTTDKPDGPPPPTGWSKLSDDELKELGVKPSDLQNKDTGYKAAIYKSQLEDPPKLVVAFAGTDDGPDVLTDVKQGVGMKDKQYDSAMALTNTVAANAKGYQVETTGHSLGGGLASAGSAVSGVKGNTYNAAGLHKNTTGNLSAADRAAHAKNVNAYHNSSDPLNNFQDAVGLAPDAYGNRIKVQQAPEHHHSWWDLLTPNLITAGKNAAAMALDGHGIGTMVDAIEAEKAADIATMGGTP
ncbi:MAG: PAAR domain-containing protein [Myxococcales bacterium]|nr:PAAR domain-containing protein [Myxococcales bacterium]